MGATHPYTIQVLNNYGYVVSDQADFDYATSLLENGVELTESTLGSDHPDLGTNLFGLGLLYAKKAMTISLYVLERSRSIFPNLYGNKSRQEGAILMQLAFSHARLSHDLKAYDFALKGISMTSDYLQREGSFMNRKDRTRFSST